MRNWLLNLLGGPLRVNVYVHPSIAAVVRPGDTLLIVPDAEAQRAIEGNEEKIEILSTAVEGMLPGVQVRVLFDCERVMVLPASGAERGAHA